MSIRPFFIFSSLLFFSACGNKTETPANKVSPSEQLDISAPTLVFPDNINDPLYSEQWAINKDITTLKGINIASEAHIHTENTLTNYTGQGIKIAIIDDGLDINHEDLDTAVTRSYSAKTQDSNVSHNTGEFHGTAVTGIIGARSNHLGIKGIASNSELFFLQFKESMTDSETIELFNKAEQWGADIINNSWGTGNVSDAVKETIVHLSQQGRQGKGISIIFSAGNNNSPLANDESAIPEVISVGSSTEQNTRDTHSNYGGELDILAPAGDQLGIKSLDPMQGLGYSNENYLSLAGTSAAAPIISGAIALLLEINPLLTSQKISDILHNSADKIGDTPYNNSRNDLYGYGKLNLNHAILDVQNL